LCTPEGLNFGGQTLFPLTRGGPRYEVRGGEVYSQKKKRRGLKPHILINKLRVVPGGKGGRNGFNRGCKKKLVGERGQFGKRSVYSLSATVSRCVIVEMREKELGTRTRGPLAPYLPGLSAKKSTKTKMEKRPGKQYSVGGTASRYLWTLQGGR